MKKLILLFVMAFTFMACPSDDDPPPPAQDPIIGTWKYLTYFENGVEQALDTCEEEDTLIFDANGDFTSEFFDEDINSECVSAGTLIGSWSNTGENSIYVFSIDGSTVTVPVVFVNNTFSIEEVDDFGTPDDPSDDVTFRDVYIRQ